MKRFCFFAIALAVLALMVPAPATASLLLDGDTLTPGHYPSQIEIYNGDLGSVYFMGEIKTVSEDPWDPDFYKAGASGNAFDVLGDKDTAFHDPEDATMVFDLIYPVTSVQFIYGGNSGIFDIVAKDAQGNILDSFYQESTYKEEPAGPITLYGNDIRELYWHDLSLADTLDPSFPFSYRQHFSAIDNLFIELDESAVNPVPEPSTLLLLGSGLLVGAPIWRRRRFQRK